MRRFKRMANGRSGFVVSVLASVICGMAAAASPNPGPEARRAEPAREVRVSVDPQPIGELVELEVRGVIALAILGGPALAVADIDPASINLAGVAPLKLDSGERARLADVDGDGQLDLLVHVPLKPVALAREDTQAVVYARTWGGDRIEGVVRLHRPAAPDGVAPTVSSKLTPSPDLRIDVAPGHAVKQVAAGLDGVVPVVIFGSASLDVNRLALETLGLSGAPVWRRWTGAPAVTIGDVNRDGRPDLTAWFATQSLALDTGTVRAELSGSTVDGQGVHGAEWVEVTRYETLTFRGGPCAGTNPVTQAAINPGTITIPDSGAAAPYPSSIVVGNSSADARVVAQVRVSLNGFTHTFPDDVDIVLQGPEGQAVMLMSDAGGSFDATGAILTFDDAAAALLPDFGAITTGVYRPSDFDPGDILPAPAPMASPGGLSVFSGSRPFGTWNLYVADDAGADSGTIAGWTLDLIIAQRVCNRTPIQIPPGGTASPYPSTITVSDPNLTGHVISKLTVTLDGLSHPFPDDVDVLLVGPGGQNITLLSDAGGPYPGVSGVTLVFDDDAASLVPDATAPVSDHYRPTNYEGGDVFPGAPPPSGLSQLSVFRGTDPAGQWRLYVYDDVVVDGGTVLDGWCLTFTTIVPTPTCNATFISIPDSGLAAPYPSTIQVTGLAGEVAEVSVQLQGLSHTWPDDVDVLLVGPQGQEVTLLSDAGSSTDVVNLNLDFDRDAVSALPDAGPLTSGQFLPTNYEGADAFPLPAPAASGGTNLSVFDGSNPNGSWSLYVVDDAAFDLGSLSSGWCLNLTLVVSPTQTCNIAPVTINVGGAATPYPASLNVQGLSAPIGEVRVSLLGYGHTWPDDVDIELSGPDGQNTILMSDAGGGSPGVSGLNLVFQDGAGLLPDDTGLVTGTYAPTDYEPGDAFIAPAPAPSGAVSLGVFAGTDPNGPWQLWVQDDVGVDGGTIAGGWCVEILPPALPPGDVLGLRWADATTLFWRPTPGAASYAVYDGASSALPRLLDCSADSSLQGETVSPELTGLIGAPGPGDFFWYLVRARNASGVGPAGDARLVAQGVIKREQNTLDNDCCAHSRCQASTRLAPGCDSCVARICAADPYCCNNQWDALCVNEGASVCGSLVCPVIGTCAHSPCLLGTTLVTGCDAPPLSTSCVTQICTIDSYCCAVSWDGACVSEVASICGLSCM